MNKKEQTDMANAALAVMLDDAIDKRVGEALMNVCSARHGSELPEFTNKAGEKQLDRTLAINYVRDAVFEMLRVELERLIRERLQEMSRECHIKANYPVLGN